MTTPAAITFECICCLEPKTENKPHTITTYPICADCVLTKIVPLFEAALKYEQQYPPKWGSEEIGIGAFYDVFSEEFIVNYTAKEIEYSIKKVSSRLYCPHAVEVTQSGHAQNEICNTFLGPKTDFTGVQICVKCEKPVCSRCGAALSHIKSEHTCNPTTPANGGLREEDRGKLWQKCPLCDRKMELSDACNEITCTCGGHFCYVCGATTPADGVTDHWALGTCPRWGPRRNAAAARHDQLPNRFQIPPFLDVEGVTEEHTTQANEHVAQEEAMFPVEGHHERRLRFAYYVAILQHRAMVQNAIQDLEDRAERRNWHVHAIGLLRILIEFLITMLEVSHQPEPAALQLADINRHSINYTETLQTNMPGEYHTDFDNIDQIVAWWSDHLDGVLNGILARFHPGE